MVRGREPDHDTVESRVLELPGAYRTVVIVEAEAGSLVGWPTVQHGGDRTPHGTEASVALADVVEQGCHGQVDAVWRAGIHEPGNVVGVALIGDRLGPEEPRARPGSEPAGNPGLLGWAKRLGEEDGEEPSDEVACRPGPPGQDRVRLHSTHSTALGRNSSRSGEISLPQAWHVP